ncbi:MAG: glycosyltransferase, partial [Vicinamibacterales bacterium]
GVKDVIESDAVGARVPDADARALAAQVARYLGDPELRRRSGDRARTAVLERYGLERLVSDIVTLYGELLVTP